MSIEEKLNALLEADREMRRREEALLDESKNALRRSLLQAVSDRLDKEDDESIFALMRIADLCAQVTGPEMADALILMLNHGEPAVRVEAGEAILDFAFDRYAEVAEAAERALEQNLNGPFRGELAFVFAEIGEPSAESLLKRLADGAEAKELAAIIEATTVLSEPSIADWLAQFEGDERVVELDEEDALTSTIGELASEARRTLTSLDEE